MRHPSPLLALFAVCGVPLALAATPTLSDPVAIGRALFVRTWTAWDPRAAPGGDGLGPMFNASSCVACHNQGAVGGGGPKEKNALLISTLGSTGPFILAHRASTLGTPRFSGGTRTERNTPALFGAGLIDAIPNEVLEREQATQALEGTVSGRVAWLPDGQIGRFGWKAHTATLPEFVATACANEIGLQVEGHAEGDLPNAELKDTWLATRQALDATRGFDLDAPFPGDGPDLDASQVAALTKFIASLPQPTEATDQPGHSYGGALFDAIGCADCHVRRLGSVNGIYADLLLHDVGFGDAASGYYGPRAPVAATSVPRFGPDGEPIPPATPATGNEWRTPPLWGVRDSAPYLHDGRAPTLDAAIRAHLGEAIASKKAFEALGQTDRNAMIAFLESLVAPGGGELSLADPTPR